MKVLILGFFSIFFWGAVVLGGYLWYSFSVKDSTQAAIGPVTFIKEEGSFSIKLNHGEKTLIKGVGRKAGEFIYNEATIHNPEGDLLPDSIDDRVKQEIKERVN